MWYVWYVHFNINPSELRKHCHCLTVYYLVLALLHFCFNAVFVAISGSQKKYGSNALLSDYWGCLFPLSAPSSMPLLKH